MAKAKKKKDAFADLQGLINQTKEQIQHTYVQKKNYVPSIIEFVESPKYLGFSAYTNPIELFPMQRVVLKVFYRGTVGNENLQLTEEEVALLQHHDLTNEVNGNVLGKYLSDHTFRELVLIWGRRCVSEDTKIIDPETGKLWTFAELWNFGKTEIDCSTYDEEMKSFRRMTKARIINQGEREVYLIETNSGHSIEVTENQPMMTENGWAFAADLRPGMKIGLAPEMPYFGSSQDMSVAAASLLGYVSSSKMTAQKNGVSILTSNPDIVEDFQKQARAFSPEIKVERASRSYYSPHGASCAYFAREDLSKDGEGLTYKLFSSNGLINKSRKDKFVPARIFQSPRNVVAAYLRSLISADAEVRYYDGQTQFYCRVDLNLPNEQIAQDVQHLLHRFGIFATIQSRKDSGGYYYLLTFSRKQDIKIFVEQIGFVNDPSTFEVLKEKVKSIEEPDDSRLIFSSILSVRKNGKKRTFDLEVSDVPHLQNFVANGFVCHNSGKDFLVSIIALYEAMKLLEAPGGNPHAMYNLSGDVPFTILSIANSAAQAGIVYNQIREKMLKSPYFDDKYLPDGITSEYIYLLTPEDKKMNIKLADKKLPLKKGSIQIRIGHSESNTLVGLDCFVILFDEIGLYKNTEGTSSGDALYHNLTPALQTYVRHEDILDENGNPVLDDKGKPKKLKIYDGKVICISTPRGQEGIFYDLYKDAEDRPHRLMCRMPTWVVNTWHSEQSLKDENPNMSEDKFNMEFGAMFSGTAGDSFFTKEIVDLCFRAKGQIKVENEGLPGRWYFAHLDPATSSHNYALCICHKEPTWNEERKQRDFVVIVDHLMFWTPTPSKPIIVEEIDEYMLKINRLFYLYLVTYDQWESAASIRKLRQWGVPARMSKFTRQYKKKIYDNLEQLSASGRLLIPDFPLLRGEMYNLQRKYLDGGAYKVMPKKDADIATDDLCDALAGAVYNATLPVTSKLPGGRLVDSPVNPSSNNILWRSMQGVPYGYGSGQQVANALKNRNPWPPGIKR